MGSKILASRLHVCLTPHNFLWKVSFLYGAGHCQINHIIVRVRKLLAPPPTPSISWEAFGEAIAEYGRWVVHAIALWFSWQFLTSDQCLGWGYQAVGLIDEVEQHLKKIKNVFTPIKSQHYSFCLLHIYFLLLAYLSVTWITFYPSGCEFFHSNYQSVLLSLRSKSV